MKTFKINPMVVYEGRRTLGAALGSLFYAAGLNLFLVPAGVYSGGIMGICQVIRTVLVDHLHLYRGNLDLAGIIYYAINIPIFIVAFTSVGKRFFAKTLITVTAMTLFLALVPTVPLVDDPMAAIVVGGILSGAGIGIVLRMGSSGGGMDVVGLLLVKWRQGFSVGKVNLFVNILLYGACFFLFDVEIVIYSIIYAAVFSIAMDKVHIQNINVEVKVITKVNSVEMEKEIFRELGRGVTKWESVGAYTGEHSQMLYILLSKYEVRRLKGIVNKYDDKAFIIVSEDVSIQGNYLRKV